MTADLRNQIRAAIDQHKRQALAQARGHGETVCAGCEGELDSQTRGCKTCYDRKRRRGKPRSDAHNRPPLRRCRQCDRRTRSRNQLCLEHSSLPSRPAGSSLAVGSCKESPVGRRPSPVESVSATNRQSREEL